MCPATRLTERFKTKIMHQFEAIRDINAKYKTPRVKMTRWV
jgi:hypothetical protein